ncbi:hypothetical protein Q8F55_008568 [Vanrija albida]|uniref:Major facilitator superfamily (MFS) profile domain-containing protein n=1 Tax=Vanrija albida TaxID=181172 RepID=A0ABR3PRI7_9TREE
MASLPIPGSVVLVDLDGHVGGPHSASHNDIILHPTPSRDINDPLNWGKWRKQVHFAMLMLYTLTAGIAGTAFNSVLLPFSAESGVPLGDLIAGIGYMFLLLGWGGLVTQPLAMTFGKRPMYLISQIGHLGMVCWMPFIHSSGIWFANRILVGIFVSPIEMLVEISIADIVRAVRRRPLTFQFFAHERGFYMGLYVIFLVGGNYIAPVWAGFANDAFGYKWVFWISAIQLAAGTIIMALFMEETNYIRGTSELQEQHDAAAPSDAEKNSDAKDDVVVHTVTAERGLEGTEYSFVQKLALYRQMYTDIPTLYAQIYRPLIFLRYPVVVWSGFLYGASVMWYNVLNATASVLFTEVYGFSPSGVGLTYLGPTIGATLAGLLSGWAADVWLLRQARRKGGVREPEDRLWLVAFITVLFPAGLILWGVGAAKQIHWIGLVIGGGIVAATGASAATFSINYVLDSYKDLGGEVVLTNTMSFAMNYAITPWLTMGYQNTFIMAALLGMALYATFYPVILFGKRWRKASAKSYWGYVESSVMAGH